uniref:Protein FAR1-RELATED SEQUENCE 4-like n=1 Tax=Nicotiana sylvestris TaxID=4096 RepID=A0A1U7XGH1_NICSY|nr:PREDICTED: protein FAR1-RELATED SEQUENCE 4-like [Nicotiana sylvestris]
METICIIVAFNGRWTEDYKYLDHQTKLVLVPEAIRFEDFIKQIFEVIELDRDKFEALTWFDINLGTSKEIIKDSTLFKIVKIEKNHDFSINTMKADQRHATSKLISDYIIDNLRDPRFEVTPAFVMAEMQKLHRLDIRYHKAWRAIQLASTLIRGTPEENYELLSSYLYMMRSKNPGTYTNIKIDDNNRFLYMFYAYGSSISGWNHCRPVIVVDATFLKLKCCGVLMISVSKDANNQIFPLAFGIAESENNNSYEWYFSKLRNAIGSRENLIFLSDRHQAIAYGIAKVYPESHHGICIYHLEQNLKRRKVRS